MEGLQYLINNARGHSFKQLDKQVIKTDFSVLLEGFMCSKHSRL